MGGSYTDARVGVDVVVHCVVAVQVDAVDSGERPLQRHVCRDDRVRARFFRVSGAHGLESTTRTQTSTAAADRTNHVLPPSELHDSRRSSWLSLD